MVLYGPPAAGKDTVSSCLEAIDSRYRLFARLKVGGGRTAGYRMATMVDVENVRRMGGLIWENVRYDALYVIDRDGLKSSLLTSIPIVHLGQSEAVPAVLSAVPGTKWLVVSLWCSREIALERVIERGTGDVDARLAAWDTTGPLPWSDLAIDTGVTSAMDAARAIDDLMQKMTGESR
ncbi:guanylate kinase [Actinokineospora alba]|nr:guanylate kinase [Actinokineospora alba]